MKSNLGIGAIVALAVVGATASAQGMGGGGKCRIPGFPAPELCARAGLDTVRARFVLLVDESGSMSALWPVLKRALADFASAIPEGDELDVRAFASNVRALIPTAPASPATRQSWRRTFESLPLPNGSATDLGSAAAAAVQAVRNAPPEQVQLVFFLTDGQHQPPAASAYEAAVGSAAWQELASSARAVTTARPISVSVVRLAANADAEVLRYIFPTALPVDALSEQALRSWFAGSSRDAAVAKLSTLIRRELSRPVALLEAADPLVTHSDRMETHRVRVTVQRTLVKTVLMDSASVPLSGGGRLDPSSLSLDSGHTQLRLAGTRHAPWVRPGSISRLIDERVLIRTRLEPSEELGRIGIVSDALSDTLQLRVSMREGGALPAWLYYTIALLAGLLILRTVNGVRKRAHRAYLDGRVIVSSMTGTPVSSSHSLRDRGLATLAVAGHDGRELLRLEARNEDGKTAIYALPLADDITVRGKPFRSPMALTSKTVFSSPSDEVTYLTS